MKDFLKIQYHMCINQILYITGLKILWNIRRGP